MCSRGNAIVLQESNLPKLIKIFAAVLNTTLLPAEMDISKRLANALKAVQPRMTQEQLGAVWAELTEEQQTRLAAALSA